MYVIVIELFKIITVYDYGLVKHLVQELLGQISINGDTYNVVKYLNIIMTLLQVLDSSR